MTQRINVEFTIILDDIGEVILTRIVRIPEILLAITDVEICLAEVYEAGMFDRFKIEESTLSYFTNGWCQCNVVFSGNPNCSLGEAFDELIARGWESNGDEPEEDRKVRELSELALEEDEI